MVHSVCRPSERITTQDALWGLVLLGLLITQAYGPLAFSQPAHPLADHPAKLPVQFTVQLLVTGQFERLGSFWFGLGVYRCWVGQLGFSLEGPRLSASAVESPGVESPGSDSPLLTGWDTQRITRRLLLGLLGIGLSLSLLLGSVDLLVQYALLGLTLLYFMNQSVASLLNWLVGLIGLAILVPGSVALLYPAGVTPHSLLSWQSLSDWLLASRSVSQGFAAIISYEGLMLWGVLVGKLGLLSPNTRLRMRLSLLQVVILPLAFLCKGAWVALALGLVALPERLLGYQPLLLTLCGFWGALLLAGVYLLELGVTIRLKPWGWARWPARVGRLSLTNYILQSILCPLLLYGDRVGVGTPLPLWDRAGIVAGTFALQLGFSWLWLKHHWQGPLESVCRQWIIGEWGSRNRPSR